MANLSQTLYVKNMVCGRCVRVVREELEKLGHKAIQIELGKVILEKIPTQKQLEEISASLAEAGCELIDNRRAQIVEQVKNNIIEFVYHPSGKRNWKLSAWLSDQLHLDYTYLSHQFSSQEAMTIEKYFIKQKTERVKELLVYNQQSISDISYEAGYSSVQHLTTQFRQQTGLTPAKFREQYGKVRRIEIDKVGQADTSVIQHA